MCKRQAQADIKRDNDYVGVDYLVEFDVIIILNS